MEVMSIDNQQLNGIEIEAVKEIVSISMHAAASAITAMLDRKVVISTPKLFIDKLDYTRLVPVMAVKIEYVDGIIGNSLMLFGQRDMQVILNRLMGNDAPAQDDFVFDELSLSAVSEVINQMMGASVAGLSNFMGKSISIAVPEVIMLDKTQTVEDVLGFDDAQHLMALHFTMEIADVVHSEFINVIPCDLARLIVNQVEDHKNGKQVAQQEPVEASAPVQESVSAPPPMAQQHAHPQKKTVNNAPVHMPTQTLHEQPMPQMAYQYPASPYVMPGQYPVPNYPYPPQYGYYPQPQYPYAPPVAINEDDSVNSVLKNSVNVQNVQMPVFNPQTAPVFGAPLSGGNMELIMNVPLSVSVEIGKTKRKIKDIMEFTPGTVIELEKQAGAPVDIVVNGQLIARGDVVVIDDNFGVRITEIIGTKDLIAAVEKN